MQGVASSTLGLDTLPFVRRSATSLGVLIVLLGMRSCSDLRRFGGGPMTGCVRRGSFLPSFLTNSLTHRPGDDVKLRPLPGGGSNSAYNPGSFGSDESQPSHRVGVCGVT